MDKDKIKKINGLLSHGSRKRIVEISGYGMCAVSQILNGRYRSAYPEKVIDAIIQVYQEEVEKKNETAEKVNALEV